MTEQQMQIPGYTVLEKIYDSGLTAVYRAARSATGSDPGGPVIIKTRSTGRSRGALAGRLEREFLLGQQLHLRGLVRYLGLIRDGAQTAIVLEDFGAVSLADVLQAGAMEVRALVDLSILMAQALEELHEAGLVHRDISPSNLFWNRATNELKIGDLGLATRILLSEGVSTDLLEGTPAYMAPEQTGRLNRQVDQRADLYALGATLYHLLSGSTPFHATDLLGMIHAHIARAAPLLHVVREEVPEGLSRVIAKLLAKDAMDRYQSASGLLADLIQCQRMLRQDGVIRVFPLGTRDMRRAFAVSGRIYGREREQEALLRAFERAQAADPRAAGSPSGGLVLVSGASGAGKSVLLQELERPIAARGGFFGSAKFDRLQAVPMQPIAAAVGGVLKQILLLSEDRLPAWSARIGEALGAEARAIAGLLPEVGAFLGDMAPVEELAPAGARARLSRLLRALTGALATAEHPLVLSLDDLQWVDPASLDLLMDLARGRLPSLLLLGSYREEEVGPGHALTLALHRLAQDGPDGQAGVTPERLALGPLPIDALARMVADATNQPLGASRHLAELLEQKTGGNPFFATRFLMMLADERLLLPPQASLPDAAVYTAPDIDQEDTVEDTEDSGQWTWDLEGIRSQVAATSAAGLLVARMARYAPETRALLARASLLGDRFDLRDLEAMDGAEADSAEAGGGTRMGTLPARLWEPVRDGLLLPLDGARRWFQAGAASTPEGAEAGEPALLRFAHDRVRDAAGEGLDGAEREQLELVAGRRLRALHPTDIFTWIDHWLRGQGQLTQPEEQRALALDCLEAARRAKAATAFEAAARFTVAGLALWERAGEPDTRGAGFALWLERLDAEYLLQRPEETLALAEALAPRLEPTQRSFVYAVVLRILYTEGRLAEGVTRALGCLAEVGVAIPGAPEEAPAILGGHAARIGEILGAKGPGALTGAPPVTDPVIGAKMEMLLEAWSCALVGGNLPMVALFTLTMVRMTLEHGMTRAAPLGYAAQAALCMFQPDYGAAGMFGEAALAVARQMDDPLILPRALNTFANFTGHCIRPLRENIAIYEESYRACLRSGEGSWGAWAVHWLRVHRFLAGEPVEETLALAEGYHAYIVSTRQGFLVLLSDLDRAILRALLGQTTARDRMDGAGFSEQAMEEACTSAGFGYGLWCLHLGRALLSMLADEPAAAQRWLDQAEPNRDLIPGGPAYSTHFFYGGLILVDSIRRAKDSQDGQEALIAGWRARLEESIQRLKHWADNANRENYQHQHLLLEAELAQLNGENRQAIDLYERAIERAREADRPHHAAFACERAARFYISTGRQRAAVGYLLEALRNYARWGATAKIEALRERYHDLQLQEDTSDQGAMGRTISMSRTIAMDRVHKGGGLDLSTVLKATGAISREIVLSRLLDKILRLAMESTGAERAVLLLEGPQGLTVQAEADLSTEAAEYTGDHSSSRIDVHLSPGAHADPSERSPVGDTLEQRADIPRLVVRYALRLNEPVVEGNARDGRFAEDLHIQTRQVRSLLCMPLLLQGKRLGVIYLEHASALGVFNSDRVEVLRILGAQAAVSIENATLYATLEQKVEARTRDLARKNDELAATLRKLSEAQEHLIQSEKMAALGQLVAGVAHEINTPIGAIRASSENIFEALKQALPALPGVLAKLNDDGITAFLGLIQRSAENREVLSGREARARRRRLAAALEEAGVAAADTGADLLVDSGIYEIDAAETRLLTQGDVGRILKSAYDLAMLYRNTATIRDAVDRVSKIVYALRAFTRQDSLGEKIRASIPDGIENVLTIHRNYLKNVDVTRRYQSRALIPCFPDALHQVWTNLINNALHAMNQRGRLEIETALEETTDGPRYVVRVIDDGPGIPEEVAPRIFEAFYTTKKSGEGTGLGLHISRNIVERHGGQIRAESRPGRTVFSVSLPV